MSDSESGDVNCGCGCFGCLTTIVSIILICYIFNCGWAKGLVLRVVGEVSTAWHSGEKK